VDVNKQKRIKGTGEVIKLNWLEKEEDKVGRISSQKYDSQ